MVCGCVCAAQVLGHTAMVVGAMTRHGDLVAWCMEHTTARPWVVAKSFLCLKNECRGMDPFTLRHRCVGASHSKVALAPLHAACLVGDVSMLETLVRDHLQCRSAIRDGSLRTEVRAFQLHA